MSEAALSLPRQMREKKRQVGGYPCPHCGHTTCVVDSRPHNNGVKRRRGCPNCLFRFNTTEIIELNAEGARGNLNEPDKHERHRASSQQFYRTGATT